MQEAIGKAQAKVLDKAEISATRVLQELGYVAFLDPAVFYKAGRLLSVEEMPQAARRALTAMEVARVNLIPNDSAQEWLHRFRFANKMDALKVLAEHLRLTAQNQKDDDADWDKVIADLKSARRRVGDPVDDLEDEQRHAAAEAVKGGRCA